MRGCRELSGQGGRVRTSSSGWRERAPPLEQLAACPPQLQALGQAPRETAAEVSPHLAEKPSQALAVEVHGSQGRSQVASRLRGWLRAAAGRWPPRTTLPRPPRPRSLPTRLVAQSSGTATPRAPRSCWRETWAICKDERGRAETVKRGVADLWCQGLDLTCKTCTN
ncbi:mitochondrial sheath formation-associated protein isoform X2 [Erinaceus europaeus]|uniref:Mitochondrial sheath formation-associated protein isoform X2 n=1 Tax=Erinaceus europaeus TaxID=9365 RepID=A0ABM3WTH2_ERIEU|nr:mitochondrial sheath formation-associated protein isoform X2 [Erinaceus europaeus]